MIWAVCRTIAAIYYTLAMASTFIFLLVTEPKNAAGALVFVTDWTCILVTVYLILATVNLFLDRRHGRYFHYTDRGSLPCIGKYIQTVSKKVIHSENHISESFFRIDSNYSMTFFILFESKVEPSK